MPARSLKCHCSPFIFCIVGEGFDRLTAHNERRQPAKLACFSCGCLPCRANIVRPPDFARPTVGPRSQPLHSFMSRTPPLQLIAANLPPIRRAVPPRNFLPPIAPGTLQPTPTGGASPTPRSLPSHPSSPGNEHPCPHQRSSHAILPKTALPADPSSAASFGVGGCVLLYSDFSVQRSRMAAANAAAHARVYAAANRTRTCSAAAYPPGMPRSRPAA